MKAHLSTTFVSPLIVWVNIPFAVLSSMVAVEHLSPVVVDVVALDATEIALEVEDVVGPGTPFSRESATAAGWLTIMRTPVTS